MNEKFPKRFLRGLTILTGCLALSVCAQESEPESPDPAPPDELRQLMTTERLGELITLVDEEAVNEGVSWYFHIEELEAVVVYDENADRMRIMIPIGPTDSIEKEELLRLMQANFDSALDARYAIANDGLWGVFIHPLSTLTDEEFLVGIGQTANVVMSYGTSYSSGLFIFGNGDSAEIERNRLIESLRQTET